MRLSRIFSPTTISADQTHSLDARAAHYLQHVLRLKVGDKIAIFDGSGGEYLAEIETLRKKKLDVRIIQFEDRQTQSPLTIELGLGISRGDRMDIAIQKATELGVSSIRPLASTRSGNKLKPAVVEKKMAHWQGVIISACEQSGLNTLPTLLNPTDIDTWAASCKQELKLVLYPNAGKSQKLPTTCTSVALAVGPEGGLDPQEIERLTQAGFLSTQLGPRVLRTETAPLAAISILQFLWGDFNPWCLLSSNR